MIDHTGIGVAEVTRSAAFYDATLSVLGLRRVMQLPENDGADGVLIKMCCGGLDPECKAAHYHEYR